MTPHTLPKLSYAYSALEPYIDAETMEIHHTKHHQAYINNLNAAIEKHPDFGDITTENLVKSLGSLPEDIRDVVRNNGGGHFNHTFFWKVMAPAQESSWPEGILADAISKTFQNFDNFKQLFAKAALGRFGSGWAWASVTSLGGLEIHSTPNQDNPSSEGLIPIIGLDVWEHAYYLKYQNRRPEYIENWWHVVDWSQVSENYTKAIESIRPPSERL